MNSRSRKDDNSSPRLRVLSLLLDSTKTPMTVLILGFVLFTSRRSIAISILIEANSVPVEDTKLRMLGFPFHIEMISAAFAPVCLTRAEISGRPMPPLLNRSVMGSTVHRSRTKDRTRLDVFREVVISRLGKIVRPWLIF